MVIDYYGVPPKDRDSVNTGKFVKVHKGVKVEDWSKTEKFNLRCDGKKMKIINFY